MTEICPYCKTELKNPARIKSHKEACKSKTFQDCPFCGKQSEFTIKKRLHIRETGAEIILYIYNCSCGKKHARFTDYKLFKREEWYDTSSNEVES